MIHFFLVYVIEKVIHSLICIVAFLFDFMRVKQGRYEAIPVGGVCNELLEIGWRKGKVGSLGDSFNSFDSNTIYFRYKCSKHPL